MTRLLDLTEQDALLQDPGDAVPLIWRDAQTMSVVTDFVDKEHPFHGRFSVDSGPLNTEAVAYVLHHVRTVHTAKCYDCKQVLRDGYTTCPLTNSHQKRARRKNREALLDSTAHWTPTNGHRHLIASIAACTGTPTRAVEELDSALRRRRANWDPLRTATTRDGRTFLYMCDWDQWIDVSYVGPTAPPPPLYHPFFV